MPQSRRGSKKPGSSRRPRRRSPAFIIGIGASSANVQSLETLFSNLPRGLDAAFVVSIRQINGLDSLNLAQLLARASHLEAEVAGDGMRLEPGRIYVGPGEELTVMEDGRLSLTPAPRPPAERSPIDSFLVSLARTYQARALGVVLHDLGSDGVAGVKALKEFGGLAIAERDSQVESGDGMIDATGLVDFVLPVEAIPERIAAYARHLSRSAEPQETAEPDDETNQRLTRIAAILRSKTGHDFHGYKQIVEPLAGPDAPSSFVVVFHEIGTSTAGEPPREPSSSVLRNEHVQRLDAELRLTRERLQATIEELKSSNEEYQSINEELQSANEELEASKEKLQSVNQELQSVNGELGRRVSDLAMANSDLKNLLESTQIATVFLDNDLRIKSFTPSVADIFPLIEADLGRPITHIASRIAYPELAEDVRRVLRTLGAVEREVGGADQARYLVRVLPYRSVDNFIAGVVFTFSDVTATVRAEAEAEAANRLTREILESVSDVFYALDRDLKFTHANHRVLELLGKREGELIGRLFAEAFPAPEFAELLQDQRRTLTTGAPVDVEMNLPGVNHWMSISIYPSSGGVSVFMKDITQRKRDEERQRLLIAELQHRAKNILSVVRSITTRTIESSDGLDEFASHFDGRLRALARTQAVLARQPEAEVDLDEMVREELLSHAAHDGQQVEIHGPALRLRHKAAETFALVLHELATNAVKYGALSAPSGRVTVGWRVMNSSAGRKLVFDWHESGVAVIDPSPQRIGFGRDMIENGLPYDLPGSATSISFGPGGLQCVIELPMNQYVVQSFETFEQAEREGRDSADER